MPNMNSLVLTDRAATPVDHTFTPRDLSQGMGTLAETQDVPVGENRVQVALKKTAGGRYKGFLKLTMPVVQTSSGTNGIETPVVVRTAFATLDLSFDATSTLQERKNIVGMLQDALDPSNTLINDTLVKLEGIY